MRMCFTVFIFGATFVISALASEKITIPEYQALGPFLVAPQEGGVDPVYFDGRQENLEPSAHTYHSLLSSTGLVGWFKVPSDQGRVKTTFPKVDWNFLQNLGGPSIIQNQSFFYAEIDRPADEIFLAYTESVGEFFVNGERYFGEPYRFTFTKTPIFLHKGKNKILLKVASYRDPEFAFMLEKPQTDLVLLDDVTSPDLVHGVRLTDGWIALPFVNTTVNWLKKLRIKILDDSLLGATQSEMEFAIAPLGVLKMPIMIYQKTNVSQETSHALTLEVRSGEKVILKTQIFLRVRDPKKNEAIKETFLSKIDGSVQYYSYLAPKTLDLKKKYSALVMLHGANVEASEMIENISPKADAYVICANNRRPHGYAYQDVGREDVLESIDVAASRHPLDRRAIFLGGHSMGGQGTWHIGLHHPTRFAGLAPSAAWASLRLYTPFQFQRSELNGRPEILRYRDRVLRDSNNPEFLENAKELPVFITHSSHDDNVPAYHSRLFYSLADALKMQIKYREIESDQHCQTTPLIDGRGWNCIDSPEQWDFLNAHQSKKWPLAIHAKILDLSVEKNFYWLTIDEQEKIFSDTVVDAAWQDKALHITSRNVNALTLNFPKDLSVPRSFELKWNRRQTHITLPASKKLSLVWGKGEIIQMKEYRQLFNEKHALKSVLSGPFLIVVGTTGGSKATDTFRNHARLMSQRAWRMGNSYAPIVEDSEVTESMMREYNLILLGSAERNKLVRVLASKLPVKIEPSGVKIGEEKLSALPQGLAAAFIYPNPKFPRRLVAVFAGTTIEAEKFALRFNPLVDRQGFTAPDFVVFSDGVQSNGWGSVRAAGFFSKSWNLQNKDFTLSH
jgi:predicted peptidase